MENFDIVREEETIKLIKGQRGSYGWEVKIGSKCLTNGDIGRLVALDQELKKSFGGTDASK